MSKTESFDLKAEIIAAELIENGADPKRVLIKADGASYRSKRLDVTNLQEQEDEALIVSEYLVLHTSRDGLYDSLPQGLFHQAAPPKNANEHEVLDYFKQHRKEEKNARKFFLPFETAISEFSISIAHAELTAQNHGKRSPLAQRLQAYWSIFGLLNDKQAMYLIELLPVFYKLRDNEKAMEEIITVLLDVPVRISLSNNSQNTELIATSSANQFGQKLGADFILGDTLFARDEEEIVLTLGPISKKKAATFLDSKHVNYQLIHTLCDYLLPAQFALKIAYEFEEKERFMQLPKQSDEVALMLGHDTIL
ncbi:MAG: type VI secretion system baseplate subunit TssG [Bacteroidetes bacterium]|nr:type VI secretion system baseplate subunit TssG [Bacteroidota bacterium]